MARYWHDRDMPARRVLVIDDEPDILIVVEAFLQRTIPGVEVMTAHSALDALTFLDQRACDLVLSDANMPDHNGFYVLNEVKRRWPSLPVVLMSGTSLAREASAAGAYGFILKPFTFQQFEAIVTAVTAAVHS
jgi:DNA-binding NtrC family response regulator